MVDTKISQLDPITTLQPEDILLVSQNGVGSYTSKKIAFEDVHSSVLTPTITELIYSSNVTTDLSTGEIFTITLTGDLGLENPINGIPGRAYTWWIRQDGSGNHAISLGNAFSIPTSATLPLSFSNSAGYMDMLAIRYSNASTSYVISLVPGYN